MQRSVRGARAIGWYTRCFTSPGYCSHVNHVLLWSRTWRSSASSFVWITWPRWLRRLLSGRSMETCSKISYVERAAAAPSGTDSDGLRPEDREAGDAAQWLEGLTCLLHFRSSATGVRLEDWVAFYIRSGQQFALVHKTNLITPFSTNPEWFLPGSEYSLVCVPLINWPRSFCLHFYRRH